MSLLTVIVPLYNNEKYIRQCLDSICNQSYRDISIIVVDDGSTDGSGLIADEIAENDDRIRVIHQENKGLAEARFCGLRKCLTEYSTFVDSDDFILNNSYEYAVEFMEKNIDMIHFEISRYYDDTRAKREEHVLPAGYYDNSRIQDEVFHRLIWDFNSNCRGLEPSQCVRITKTELLRSRYEEFTDRVHYGEDSLITYPLYLKIKSLEIVPYSYYMHRQYMTGRPYICADGFFKEVYDLYNQLVKAFKSCFDMSYDFKKQIDHLYMYLVQEKKDYTDQFSLKDRFLFPFDKTVYGKNILLYGAGVMGHVYYNQLNKIDYCKDLLWVDRNYDFFNDKRIKNVDEIKKFDADYVVIAIENKTIHNEVVSFLIESGIDRGIIV